MADAALSTSARMAIASDSAARTATASTRTGRRGAQRPILLCRAVEGTLQSVWAERDGNDFTIAQIDWTQPASGLARRVGQALVIALLPRSAYVVRQVETPKTSSSEAAEMLQLEVEAALPREFGESEIGFRILPGAREGYQHYEVSIARREDLNRLLKSMESVKIHPDVVLPSSILWGEALQQYPNLSMLVAAFSATDLEVALTGASDTIVVRSITAPSDQVEDPSGRMTRGLVECLRSAVPRASSDGLIHMGVIGEAELDLSRIGEQVLVHDLNQSIANDNAAGVRGRSALEAAARLLLDMQDQPELKTANLLPKEIIGRATAEAVRRNLFLSAACVVLAIAMTYCGLRISTARLAKSEVQLSKTVAKIKTEGEAVGRRLEQLRAVRAARLSGRQFPDVLNALYDATPPDVTYSDVDLTDTGELHLRGHAKSLSLPFLLPERLQKTGIFQNVLLLDAGQVKQGDSAITEFRIDATMKQGSNR